MIFLGPKDLGNPDIAAELTKQPVYPDTFQPLDILFVGAHPDDLEIACGGTIHTLTQQGYRVGLVDLTDGEPTPASPSPETRWVEAKAAAQVLGVQYRRLLHLPNRCLMDGFQERLALAKEFRFWKPSIVVGFGNKTPMASPDHYQAMQITDAAVFYSRLTKWDEHFGGLPPHSIHRQLYFKLSLEPSPIVGFDSLVTVDISQSLEKKIEAIACYKTQFPPSKAYVFDRVRGLAIATGAAANVAAGEIFASTRQIVVKDLVAFLDTRATGSLP